MDKNNYEGIKYLLELAKLGSITLVTKKYNVDHKTIKQRLMLLEKFTGKNLVNSSSHGTTLTEDGWIFHNQLSNDFYRLTQKFKSYLNKQEVIVSNTFDILLPPVTSIFFSIHVLPVLYKKFPELSINITTLNISYILSYGSHIKNIINSFNMVALDHSVMNLINQEEWYLALTFEERLKLFSTKEYLLQNNIKNFEDIQNAKLIAKLGSKEEYGYMRFKHSVSDQEKLIKFNNVTTAENDLIKCHLTNQGVGISLLSSTALKCDQNINIIEIFSEYTYNEIYKYSLVYKKNNTDQKYINEIIDIAKKEFRTV